MKTKLSENQLRLLKIAAKDGIMLVGARGALDFRSLTGLCRRQLVVLKYRVETGGWFYKASGPGLAVIAEHDGDGQ